MKKFLKRFPFTSYGVFVITIIFVMYDFLDGPRDEIIPMDPLFWISILSIPLIGIGQIYNFLNIEVSLPWVIPICFLLDLLILYIRKCLIPAIRGKNKKLLIPSFFKVFSKLRNGKN